MKRKKIEYPTYEQLLKLKSVETVVKNSLCELRFVPAFEDYAGHIAIELKSGCTMKMLIDYKMFDNTLDGYKQAIEVCEKYVDEQLSKMEQEYYEE